MENRPGESGAALLLTLIALSLFSLLGMFMSLNAATGLKISDNYESHVQATYAALSGLSHGRAALRGLDFDDLLKGPDGTGNRSPSYLAQARTFAYRNLVALTAALSLSVEDPSPTLAGLPDDGLINTGYFNGVGGTALIPLYGIAQVAPNPYGPGTIVTSRYFVKVADNNGEPSEIAGDPANDPFLDGDGVIIMRSIGVAGTLSDSTGPIRRNNSVAIFESRIKRRFCFDLGPALVLQGVQISPSFAGAYEISGGEFPAIGTMDADIHDGIFPDQTIRLEPLGDGSIQGANLPQPSVQEISAAAAFHPDKSLLLQPDYLWKLTRSLAARSADLYYAGDQAWSGSNAPYLGSYDISKPVQAAGQDPKLVVVNGNLQLTGNISGGGLLVVTGDLSCSGSFVYNGLILVIGSGRLSISGSGSEIKGGVYVSNLSGPGGAAKFGSVAFSINGSNRIVAQMEAVRMASRLLPPSQIGFREIAGADP